VAYAPPVIDCSGLADRSEGAIERVAAELAAPCRESGVFHVAGHGVPESHLREFDAAMRRFFALPRAVKQRVVRTRDNARGFYDRELTKNRPDWKEVFDYGADHPEGDPRTLHSDGRNQWPGDLPGLREILTAHFVYCERFSLELLRALCMSLGADPDSLVPAFRQHTSFVRLNHYARCPNAAPGDAPLFPDDAALGVHHHTDAGALTLLYQDEVAGLQAWLGDAFATIDPVPGALTVNLGDMLQVCSNDRFVAPLHRVVASPDRTRFSAPFFLNPGYDTTYEPLATIHGTTQPARYRSVSWSHFRDQRSAGDFADYGQEIQISDYRIEA
jgi:isopenicillin N synthase-like dioxygenase